MYLGCAPLRFLVRLIYLSKEEKKKKICFVYIVLKMTSHQYPSLWLITVLSLWTYGDYAFHSRMLISVLMKFDVGGYCLAYG